MLFDWAINVHSSQMCPLPMESVCKGKLILIKGESLLHSPGSPPLPPLLSQDNSGGPGSSRSRACSYHVARGSAQSSPGRAGRGSPSRPEAGQRPPRRGEEGAVGTGGSVCFLGRDGESWLGVRTCFSGN